jgi:hypothetical protein
MVGLCFCVAGVLTVVVGLWAGRKRIDKVRQWRPAQAEVVSAVAVVESGTETDQSFTNYEVRYSVEGVRYTPKFRTWSASLEEAQTKTARHAQGSSGTIYYNPRDPQEIDANLGINPSTLSTSVWIISGGICAILFGIMFAVLGGASGSRSW